jgi:CheY-like chemotaxis protein
VTKILIIDDNESIVKVMRLLLEREGFQVNSADDDAVYSIAESWQPSVILMDVRLPKLDGVEACQRLKNNPMTTAIPIILLTADTTAAELQREGGADDLLMKPFHNADLLEKVRKHSGSSTEQANIG